MVRAVLPRVVLLIAAVLLSFVSLAHADDRYRVVLLEPRISNDFSAEVLTRVRSELEASSFRLEVLPAPKDLSSRLAVETAASELDPEAVLLIEQRLDSDSTARSVEIWLSDRIAQRTFVQRLDVERDDPNRGATWVALQAVELVRARLADATLKGRSVVHTLPSKPSPPNTTAQNTSKKIEPTAEARPRFALGAGVGVLPGFDGLSATYAPVLRASVGLADLPSSPNAVLAFNLRLSGSTMGSAATVRWEARSAEVRQSFATLDIVARFAPNLVVQPLLSIGAGAYAVDVSGSSEGPYQNQEQVTWSGLGTLGTGLWLIPFEGAACVVEGQMMAAWSKTIVRLGDRTLMEVGFPLSLLSVSVLLVF